MRLFLGGSLLVLLFLAASLWQKSWTSAARAERSAERGDTIAASTELPAGWSRVVIGRPSGVEPYRGPGPSAPEKEASDARQDPASSQPKPAVSEGQAKPSRVFVQAGQNLTAICREHYGTARADVVAAVSRHNKLANPDALREGQALELPPLEQLTGKR